MGVDAAYALRERWLIPPKYNTRHTASNTGRKIYRATWLRKERGYVSLGIFTQRWRG